MLEQYLQQLADITARNNWILTIRFGTASYFKYDKAGKFKLIEYDRWIIRLKRNNSAVPLPDGRRYNLSCMDISLENACKRLLEKC